MIGSTGSAGSGGGAGTAGTGGTAGNGGGATQEICDDGKDNEFDGQVDCDADDCADFPGCVGDLYAAS